MSRADGKTSEAVASFLYEETLSSAEQAKIQGLIGALPAFWPNAVGDGIADDTAAINAAISQANAAGGGVVVLRKNGRYKVNRRVVGNQAASIKMLPNVSLEGNGATIIQDDNATTLGNAPDQTIHGTITEDCAIGQQLLTLDSTSSFMVGDTVGVRLGDNPWDGAETCRFYFATVVQIVSATVLKLDIPAPSAMTVASTLANNRALYRYRDDDNGLYQNCFVRNLVLEQGSWAGAVVESAVWFSMTRNIVVENIVASSPGSGIMMSYGVNNTVRNLYVPTSIAQGGQGSKGRVINGWNLDNCLFENIHAKEFQGCAFFMESYCRRVTVRNVKLINNWVASKGTAKITNVISYVVQGSQVHFSNLDIEGIGSDNLFADGSAPGVLTADNVYVDGVLWRGGAIEVGNIMGGRFKIAESGNITFGLPNAYDGAAILLSPHGDFPVILSAGGQGSPRFAIFTGEDLVNPKFSISWYSPIRINTGIEMLVSALASGNNVELDFGYTAGWQTLELIGGTTFSTVRLSGGRAKSIRMSSGIASRDLTFPAGWKFVDGARPAALAANKIAMLELKAFGTTDADVVASYVLEA